MLKLFLIKGTSATFLYCFGLLDFQAFQKPAPLLCCKKQCFCLIARPLKPAVIKSFVQKQKSIAFPEQAFDAVTPPSAEQE